MDTIAEAACRRCDILHKSKYAVLIECDIERQTNIRSDRFRFIMSRNNDE